MKKAFSNKWVICVCIAVMGSTTAFGDFVDGNLSNAAPDLSGGAIVLGGTLAIFNEEDSLGADTMTLNQEVELGPGNYILSYDIFFFSGAPADSDFFNVTWGGGTPLLSMNNKGEDNYYELYGLTEEIDPAHPDWITWFGTVEHSLEISSPLLTNELMLSLQVDHSTPDFTRVSIDNVEIVPVPSSLLLGGLGLAVANWRLKRRKTA